MSWRRPARSIAGRAPSSRPPDFPLIKSTAAAYPALEARIRELHPYELPEIVALPVALGLPDYLNWIAAETLQ
jgi:uncharacterized protein involved in tolerance to divalent cations